MGDLELLTADLWATGITPEAHPVEHLRPVLDRLGAVSAATLAGVADGDRVLVGGIVTHRQRPATAGGITFLDLEDETGMTNIVCSPGLWTRHRTIATTSSALLARGRSNVPTAPSPSPPTNSAPSPSLATSDHATSGESSVHFVR